MVNRVDKNLIYSFICAFIGHLLVFALIPQSPKGEKIAPQTRTVFKVKTYDQEAIKKYRTVGVKGGAKEFSSPLRPTKALSASDLRPHKLVRVKKVTKKQKLISAQLFKGKHLKLSNEDAITQGLEKNKILKKMALPPAMAKSLGRSNLNIKFQPPEGVNEDELNSSEKKFFSFTKRSYETYVVSIIKSLNEIVKDRPHLKNLKNIGRHHLTGRIIFDKDGYPISLKFIQPSRDDNIQILFENALRGIDVLHNPPKELLDKEQRLTVYYQLSVEG
ncbi:MAG: hypothetical protein ACO20H_04290 [Bacteriovoracaceae bacterium]